MSDLNLEDLRTVTELANEFEVSRGAVWNWAERYPDFPEPKWRNFYDVEEVREWRESLR